MAMKRKTPRRQHQPRPLREFGSDGRHYTELLNPIINGRLWIVFQHKRGSVREFQGVFTSRELARAACKTWRYSYRVIKLNKELPKKRVMTKCVYPIKRKVNFRR